MKKITLLFLLFWGLNSFGQKLFFEVGKTASSFEYTDLFQFSLGNLHPKTQDYLSLGYAQNVIKDKIQLSLGMTYNSYGTVGSDNLLFNFYEWDVDYLGINLGIDLQLISIKEFSFYIKSIGTMEYIVQGRQNLNNQIFNISGFEEFSRAAFFYGYGCGISYPISSKSKIYFEYMHHRSTKIDQSVYSLETVLNINLNMVGIGILIDLVSDQSKN